LESDKFIVDCDSGSQQWGCEWEVNKMNVADKIQELILNMSEPEQQKLLNLLEGESSVDRRNFPRKPVSIAVDYRKSQQVFKDFIQNVSGNGIFIETMQPFEVGEKITLSFTLPDVKLPIKVEGKVARVAPEGIGVSFDLKDLLKQDLHMEPA
jgi:Tfp pilus assembly protein PilZ